MSGDRELEGGRETEGKLGSKTANICL
jgi:hypothetical protein